MLAWCWGCYTRPITAAKAARTLHRGSTATLSYISRGWCRANRVTRLVIFRMSSQTAIFMAKWTSRQVAALLNYLEAVVPWLRRPILYNKGVHHSILPCSECAPSRWPSASGPNPQSTAVSFGVPGHLPGCCPFILQVLSSAGHVADGISTHR